MEVQGHYSLWRTKIGTVTPPPATDDGAIVLLLQFGEYFFFFCLMDLQSGACLVALPQNATTSIFGKIWMCVLLVDCTISSVHHQSRVRCIHPKSQRRSHCSHITTMGRLSRDKRDIFYRLAKEKGYRARSAFKLLQLDAEFALFGPHVHRVVDLCAAPGSWCQVVIDKLYEQQHLPQQGNETINALEENPDEAAAHPTPSLERPRVVAVDLQPMAPIQGVHMIQGDITSIETAQKIIVAMNDADSKEQEGSSPPHRAELVLCDGAPDVTGLHDVDEYLQGQLLLAALLISTHVLATGGTLVAKIFRGPHVMHLYDQLRLVFHRVSIAKPTSSRNSSMEAFVVCQNFRGAPYQNLPLDIGGYINLQRYVLPETHTGTESSLLDDATVQKNRTELAVTIPFLACGDLSGWRPDWRNGGGERVLDADKSYPMQASEHIAPIAPPMDPPYQSSIEKQKVVNLKKNFDETSQGEPKKPA